MPRLTLPVPVLGRLGCASERGQWTELRVSRSDLRRAWSAVTADSRGCTTGATKPVAPVRGVARHVRASGGPRIRSSVRSSNAIIGGAGACPASRNQRTPAAATAARAWSRPGRCGSVGPAERVGRPSASRVPQRRRVGASAAAAGRRAPRSGRTARSKRRRAGRAPRRSDERPRRSPGRAAAVRGELERRAGSPSGQWRRPARARSALAPQVQPVQPRRSS